MAWKLKEWGSEWTDFRAKLTSAGARAKLLTWLERLSEAGHELRSNVRHLGEGLLELKISHKRVAYRCMYAFHTVDKEDVVVLLVCFVKKKQRDQRMVELARKRLKILKNEEVELGDVTLH